MCLIGNFRACRASKIGDPELPWSVHDLAFRSSSLFGMIDTLPLSKFSTYSSTLLADAILGPLGFGWRGRIPFALTTRSLSLSSKTFVGYHPVGIRPNCFLFQRSRTATELVSANVTYSLVESTAHEDGAVPNSLPFSAKEIVESKRLVRVSMTERLSESVFTTYNHCSSLHIS